MTALLDAKREAALTIFRQIDRFDTPAIYLNRVSINEAPNPKILTAFVLRKL